MQLMVMQRQEYPEIRFMQKFCQQVRMCILSVRSNLRSKKCIDLQGRDNLRRRIF